MDSIANAIVGALMFCFAYFIGVKKQLSLLHDYHYQNLKEKDKDAYAKTMGIGLAVMGVSFFVQAMIGYIYSSFSIPVLLLGLFIGLGILIYAQYKYNGGIFS